MYTQLKKIILDSWISLRIYYRFLANSRYSVFDEIQGERECFSHGFIICGRQGVNVWHVNIFGGKKMKFYILIIKWNVWFNSVVDFSHQLNPDVNAFQRKFVNEVRRCEEMERKLSKWNILIDKIRTYVQSQTCQLETELLLMTLLP